MTDRNELAMAWMETANQHCRNEFYYRGLVEQIGALLGPIAFISDDGSVQDEILCAKVPELVKSTLSTTEAKLARAVKALEKLKQATATEVIVNGAGFSAKYLEAEDFARSTLAELKEQK